MVEPSASGCLYLGVGLAVFAEAEDGRHHGYGNQEGKHHARRSSNTDKVHRCGRNGKKRQQCGKRGQGTEQYRPAHLAYRVYDRLPTIAVHLESSPEKRVYVYVVGYRHGKSQQHRYQHHTAVYRETKISEHTVGHHDRPYCRNDRHYDSPQRSGGKYQHYDCQQYSQPHNTRHLLAYPLHLLVGDIGQSHTFRVEGLVLVFSYDVFQFSTCQVLGRHRAFALIPYRIVGEGAQFEQYPSVSAVLRYESVGDIRFEECLTAYLCKPCLVGRYLFGHNLFDRHTLFVAYHKFDVGDRGHLVGIRHTVEHLVRQLAYEFQIFLGKSVVAIGQYGSIIVVAEYGFELFRFEQYGVVFEEVALPRVVDFHKPKSIEPCGKQSNESDYYHPSSFYNPFASTGKPSVDLFYFHLYCLLINNSIIFMFGIGFWGLGVGV